MTQVTFFLLDQESESKLDSHLELACELAANCFRNKQRCLVLCEDKGTAEQFDELLWQQPVDSFVPHNLSGEGPKNGAPVEICWETPAQFSRAILINLRSEMADFTNRFRQVYDFVPAQELQKQQARERYKHYRAAGYQLDTRPARNINENQDG